MTKRKATTEKKQADYIYRKKGYIYFRDPRDNSLTPLPRDEASDEFKIEHKRLKDALLDQPPAPPAERPVAKVAFLPGSIGWFIQHYQNSRAFAKLSKNTQKSYRIGLTMMAGEIGAGLLHDFTPEAVDHYSKRILDKTESEAMADQQITLITNLWQFAKGFVEFKRGSKVCPTLGATRHYEHNGVGHLAWPPEVIEKFDATAKHHLQQYRMGLHYTGQRGVDVVKMRWDDFEDGLMHVVQEKTGEHLWLQCPDPLREMLDRMPRVSEYVFTNLWGRPYASAASLSNCLKRHLILIQISGKYTMHGLRKNAGMELALADATVPQIMAVLGHTSPKMALFYVKQASKRRHAKAATGKWNTYIKDEKLRRVAERRATIKRV